MYLSKQTYKAPLDENTWYTQKRLIGDKYYYYLFRRIREKKETIYIGSLDNIQEIENRIREHEETLDLPKNLKTNLNDLVLIEVEPEPKDCVKTRQPVDPGKTKWYGRVIRNGSSYPIYLYRKILRKTHRVYLGTEPSENEIREKIAAYETKIGLEEKYKTDPEKFKLKIKKD